jgi:TRAP-type C4-dicarboxylate transport system permease small subunit
MLKTYRTAKDLHVLRIVFIIILLWFAVWGLADELFHWIEQKYKLPRWKLYLFVLLIMLTIVLVDPHTFDRL